MKNNDKDNLIESLKIKLVAHEKFIVSHLLGHEQRRQAFQTFGAIYSNVCEGNIEVPSKLDNSLCAIIDEETHYNVIDTYEEIFEGMYGRFYGRSGNFYLEKL